MQAFRLRAFFYCWPALRHPQTPPLLIAFPRPLGRTLQAPLQSGKKLPYMAGMIANARGLLDHRRHPGQRPQIGFETVSLRALTQSRVHLLALRLVQLRPAACPPRSAHPIGLVLTPGREPSAYALTADVEFTGDLCLGTLAGGKQPRGTAAAFLHGGEVTARRTGSCHA